MTKLAVVIPLVATLSACVVVRNEAPVPAEFTFEFRGPEGDPSAVVMSVRKNDPAAGRVTWEGRHAVGDRIGGSQGNGAWTSRHVVLSPLLNRDVETDFDTGLVLRDIRMDVPIPYEFAQCQVRPAAPPIISTLCDGIRMIPATYQADEIVYTDRTGKE